MTLFIVVGTFPRNFETLGQSVAEAYKDNHLRLNPGCWIIADSVTAREVSEKIGVGSTATPSGTAVVASVANYYGRASTEIWEWMKSRLSAGSATHG